MRGMNLQQTSCLLLLKVIPYLGKLNGGGIVPVLSVVYVFIVVMLGRGFKLPLFHVLS